jgi:hypothetical protein
MIFLLLVLNILIFRIFFIPFNKIGIKYYCILISFLLLIIAGLRSLSVGIDTHAYVYSYINSLYMYNFEDLSSFIRSEFLFQFFSKIIRYFSENYTIYLTIIATFYSIVIGRFIYKYSKEPTMSFLMLLSMGYYFFSMTGLRQTIAICFIVIAIDKLIEEKKISFFILVLIAGLFHQSAFIGLLIYILNKLKVNYKYIFVIGIISLFVYIFGPLIINHIVELFWPTRQYGVEEYGGTSTIFLLIIISIVSFILMSWKRNIDSNFLNINSLFIKLVMFSIPIQVLAIYQANSFRVAMYFHIVSIILVPNIINDTEDKLVRLLGYLITITLLLIQFFYFSYYYSGIIPYTFFWER